MVGKAANLDFVFCFFYLFFPIARFEISLLGLHDKLDGKVQFLGRAFWYKKKKNEGEKPQKFLR